MSLQASVREIQKMGKGSNSVFKKLSLQLCKFKQLSFKMYWTNVVQICCQTRYMRVLGTDTGARVLPSTFPGTGGANTCVVILNTHSDLMCPDTQRISKESVKQ